MQLAALKFTTMAGVQDQGGPCRGTAPVAPEVIAGHVQRGIADPPRRSGRSPGQAQGDRGDVEAALAVFAECQALRSLGLKEPARHSRHKSNSSTPRHFAPRFLRGNGSAVGVSASGVERKIIPMRGWESNRRLLPLEQNHALLLSKQTLLKSKHPLLKSKHPLLLSTQTLHFPSCNGGEIQKVAYADSEVQATMLASTPANGIQHGGAGNLKCVRNAKAAFEKNLLPPGETAFRTRPTIGVATQREQIRAVP